MGNYYDRVIDIESKGDYKAHSEGSSYYGLGQFSETSAAEYLNSMGKTWDDYLSSADVQRKVLEMETAKNEQMMRSYGKGNITDLDRWVAHNLGYGNWRKIQKGQVNDDNLISAIRNQHGNSNNVNEYLSFYGNNFGAKTRPSPAPVTVAAKPDRLAAKPNPNHGKGVANLFQGLGKVEAPPQEPDIQYDIGLGKFAGF